MASEEPILELALSLHRQLRQLTDTHYRLHGEDALGTFLRVHGCVHQRVANSEYSSPDLFKAKSRIRTKMYLHVRKLSKRSGVPPGTLLDVDQSFRSV